MAFPLTNMSVVDALADVGQPAGSIMNPFLRRRQFKNLTSGPVSTEDLRGSVACIQPKANSDSEYATTINPYNYAGLSSTSASIDENRAFMACAFTCAANYQAGYIFRSAGYLPESGRVRVTATGRATNGYTSLNAEIVGSQTGYLSGGNIYYGTPGWGNGSIFQTFSFEFDIDPDYRYLTVNLQCLNRASTSLSLIHI